VEINEEEFSKKIVNKEKFVADFFAVWCPPCKRFAPIFENASKLFNEKQVKVSGKSDKNSCDFVKVNVDNCPDISEEYGVRSVPTIILFDKGEAVDSHIGTFATEKEVLDFVNRKKN
jgi:thioredoxin 1